MTLSILDLEKQHLAELLEAIQRCVYFLDASSSKLIWPLTVDLLETHSNSTQKSCLPLNAFVLSLSKHERRRLATDSASRSFPKVYAAVAVLSPTLLAVIPNITDYVINLTHKTLN